MCYQSLITSLITAIISWLYLFSRHVAAGGHRRHHTGEMFQSYHTEHATPYSETFQCGERKVEQSLILW